MPIKQEEFCLPLVRKERITNDTYSFYFDRVRRGLDFLPGQYIRMTLSIEKPDERGSSRIFTIASSPLEKRYIMITTKIISHSGKPKAHPESDSGQARMTAFKMLSSFKKELLELKVGDMVKFSGPFGGFVLNEEEKEDRVFLAGGIGITPFHSMTTYAEKKKLSIPITLLVSFSTVEEIVFYKELLNVAKKNPNIKIVYTVSHPESSKIKWNGEVGRISDSLIKKYVQNVFKPLYYIVGPPKMVAAIEEAVKNMGVESKKIFIENFTGY